MEKRWRFGLRRLFFWIAFWAVMLSGVVRVRDFDLSEWDEAPEPGYFVIAVRLDGWNSLPVMDHGIRAKMIHDRFHRADETRPNKSLA